MGPDGAAVTRSSGWHNSDTKVFGTTPAGAVTTNPRGGGWTPMPKSPSRPGKYTTGDQRRPKR